MNVESCMPGYLSNKPPQCYDLNVHITTKFTYLDFVKHQMTFDGHPLMVFQSCSFYSSIFCAELANNVSTHKSFSLKNILILWIWFHELLIFLYFCKEGISMLYLIKESIKLLNYFQMWQKISRKDWSLLLVLCKYCEWPFLHVLYVSIVLMNTVWVKDQNSHRVDLFTVNMNNMASIYMFIELFINKFKWKCGSTDRWFTAMSLRIWKLKSTEKYCNGNAI